VARRGPDGESLPKVHVVRGADADFDREIVVGLLPGQAICTALRPLYFGDGLRCAASDDGYRWEATARGLVAFAMPDASNTSTLNAEKAPYLVRADLVVLRLPSVRMEESPLPGFAVASGGRVWIRIPGYAVRWPELRMRSAPGLADLERLAWLKNPDLAHLEVTETLGRRWIRLGGNAEATLHTGDRG
jgi:hypothetical protein